jgi:hypothetical protein
MRNPTPVKINNIVRDRNIKRVILETNKGRFQIEEGSNGKWTFFFFRKNAVTPMDVLAVGTRANAFKVLRREIVNFNVTAKH